VDNRRLVDPEGRYPADGLRTVEAHALRVIELLPGAQVERTRDVVQIERGGEAGVVVLVTREALELRMPCVEWTMGAYGPAPASRLWKRVEWEQLHGDALSSILAQVLSARVAEFNECRFCRAQCSPDRMLEADVCHACAEQHLGVVF
jgi:hypothetical protein